MIHSIAEEARDLIIILHKVFKKNKGSENEFKHENTYKRAVKSYESKIIEDKMVANEEYIYIYKNHL